MFIVLYGINNLGKSTQAKKLVERMNSEGYKTEYLKYPIYTQEPAGPIINNYLREGNIHNLTPREAQLLYVLDRTQHESVLKQKLNQGIHIVAEDYVGTGISWGIGAGVDESFLKKINSHLLKEDIAFLFEGNRFTEATETGHKHETNNELIETVRKAHDALGTERDWIRINANETIEEIHEKLWSIVALRLNQISH
ncbi:MAG: hypothetical protein KBD29_00635 [Candidatus Magasanikbacteria bacterium]|nr:hypothetical protein [Candidatus Magasanikbacteria bacterium]